MAINHSCERTSVNIFNWRLPNISDLTSSRGLQGIVCLGEIKAP